MDKIHYYKGWAIIKTPIPISGRYLVYPPGRDITLWMNHLLEPQFRLLRHAKKWIDDPAAVEQALKDEQEARDQMKVPQTTTNP